MVIVGSLNEIMKIIEHIDKGARLQRLSMRDEKKPALKFFIPKLIY